MIFLENILGTSERTLSCLRYLDDLVQSTGGMTAFLRLAAKNPIYNIQNRFMCCFYLVGEVPFRSDRDFCQARLDFISSLQHISDWSSTLCMGQHNVDQNQGMFWALCTYLSRLVDVQLLSMNSSFTLAAGAFYCCYDMCLTLSYHEWSRSGMLEYMSCVQSHVVVAKTLKASPDTLHALQMVSNAHNLVAIRQDMQELVQCNRLTDQKWVLERQICHQLVDGLKLFALMPNHIRSQLTRLLCRFATCVTEEISSMEFLDQSFLDLVDRELIRAWDFQRSRMQ